MQVDMLVVKERETPYMTAKLPLARAVIADDHALVRGGIAMLLRILNSDCEVLETNGYEQTLALLSRTEDIDLVLFDFFMPDVRGMEDIAHICRTWPDVPIVLVTMEEDINTIHSALKAGVSGYIPKSSTPEVTMSAIRLVLSGGIYLPPSAIRPTDADLGQGQFSDPRRPIASGASEAKAGLTRRQIEVLDLMVLGKSNKAIAEAIGLTPGTVKIHMSRIFKVLKVSNRTEAARKYSAL
jgi:DNA-binding NarL/FixJ family response regulator